MPTPVSVARQCLTEEAAKSLDDAVAVACRRNHAQTTSLHVISALLSSSSLLRDACSRSRSRSAAAAVGFSSRLQFRALDLSVGVSLDRLPCSKVTNNAEDASPPPVSNSLMAAIKRSQANQRRQPDMYQLTAQMCQNSGNPISISSIKVELKQFVLSILDDPVVSRVFAEAGFRSCDIKLSIIRPPPPPLSVSSPPSSRYFKSRCPPVFLCNFSESGYQIGGRSFNLPFSFDSSSGEDYARRISEVMVRESGRNPMLVGVGAREALSQFKDCVDKGKCSEMLLGLRYLCLEKEVKEFVAGGAEAAAMMEGKVEEVRMMAEGSTGASVVINVGGLEVLVEDGATAEEAVRWLVPKIGGLVGDRRKKVWLIGSVSVYGTYSKFLERFPTIEKDWDLHPLPVTSSKSSLMGSFVPFAGFFSGPSEFKSPFPITNQCFTRCAECNDKCERELSAFRRGGSSASMVDKCSESLPSWLRMADSNLNRVEGVVAEIKDDQSVSKPTILALERKWDDICKRHQQIPATFVPGISLPRPETLHSIMASKHGNGRGDLSLNERVSSGLSSCLPFMAQTMSSQQHDRTASAPLAENADSSSKLGMGTSTSRLHDRDSSSSPTSRPYATALPYDQCSSNSVTTDLGLGTIPAYKNPDLRAFGSEDHGEPLLNLSNAVANLDKINGSSSTRLMHSCAPTSPDLGAQLDPGEYKSLYRKLIDAVGWQQEASHNISQIVLSCRSRNGIGVSSARRDIWMTFGGPDRVGKRKLAEALAEAIFGSRESLLDVDLSCQGRTGDPSSFFSFCGPNDSDKVSRKTTVGYIAEELTRRPHSVVFLENVDEADLVVQGSLFHAIRTGRFPDSHGREVSISNTVFVNCVTPKEKMNVSCETMSVRYPEHRVLEARNWQMQIVVTDKEEALQEVSLNKRKLSPTSNSKGDSPKKSSNLPKNYIDLNLPLDESGESTDLESSDSASVSDSSRAWLPDFMLLVHGNVEFKPFDFDVLSDHLANKITLQFHKNLGSGTSLEVEGDVMIQLLAAAWSSSRKGAIEDWIEQVLGTGFAEARQRLCITAPSMVKVVACKGVCCREQVCGIRLPTRVSLG